VSILPLDRVRHFAPVVMAFVNKVALSDDGRFRPCFVGGVKKCGRNDRHDSRSTGCLQKSSSAGGMTHVYSLAGVSIFSPDYSATFAISFRSTASILSDASISRLFVPIHVS